MKDSKFLNQIIYALTFKYKSYIPSKISENLYQKAFEKDSGDGRTSGNLIFFSIQLPIISIYIFPVQLNLKTAFFGEAT